MSIATLPGDLVKLSVFCADGNQASVNTFWYGVVSVSPTGCTDAEMADEYDTSMSSAYKVILNNNSTYKGVTAQIYRSGTPFVPQIANTRSGVGTAGAVSLPKQCCGLISWRTNRAGPRYRGRTYLPFFSSSSDTGDGSMNAGTQTNVQAIATLVLAFTHFGTSNISTCEPLVKHKNARGVQPTGEAITLAEVVPQWATQRKRGYYGRVNTSPV